MDLEWTDSTQIVTLVFDISNISLNVAALTNRVGRSLEPSQPIFIRVCSCELRGDWLQ